jgi:hypothetical protein
MKKLILVLCFCLIFSGSLSVYASEEFSTKLINVYTQTFEDNGVKKELTNKQYSSYREITIKDELGNVVSMDTRNNYIEQNGEKIYFSISNETTHTFLTLPMSAPILTKWVRIRTDKFTVTFDKYMSNLTIDAIVLVLSRPIGIVTRVVRTMAEGLKAASPPTSKIAYVCHDVYGYRYHLNAIASKRYSMTSQNVVVPGVYYYNPTPYKFPDTGVN